MKEVSAGYTVAMRFIRSFVMALAVGAVMLAPAVALGADTSPLQEGWTLYPKQCECPDSAPDFKCVGAIIQNLVNLAISVGVVIFVLVASYAGVLLMASAVNPRGKEQAKSMLTNAVVGLIIALAAWLFIDFIMSALYNKRWGAWNSILANEQAEFCLKPNTTPGPARGNGDVTAEPGTGDEEPTEPEPPTQPAEPSTVEGITITVDSQTPVSQSAQNKLRQVLASANLTSATIVSGTRTPADQARIMEENLHNNIRINYAAPGTAVTRVYDEMKAQNASRAEIRTAMVAEINRQGCSNVSRHCSTQDVIDVRVGSISNRSAFETALTNSSLVARFYRPGELNEPGYHIEFR